MYSIVESWVNYSIPLVSSNLMASLQKEWCVDLKKVSWSSVFWKLNKTVTVFEMDSNMHFPNVI